MFLNKTLVTYTQRGTVKDTFGSDAARVVSLVLRYRSGKAVTINGAKIPRQHAKALRMGEIAEIDAVLR